MISGHITQIKNKQWDYTHIGEALGDTGLEEIWEYTTRLNNSGTKYIAKRTIFDIAMEEDMRPGPPAIMSWWEQEVIRFGNEGRRTYESDLEWE